MFTRPLRKLTPSTSLGFDVVDFADWVRNRLEELHANRAADDDTDYLGLLPRLLEWQRWLLIHALELMPGPDLIFRFRTVLLLVGRQNGKTTLLVYLILWRMYQDGAKQVLGTAQSLEVAEEAWSLAVQVAEAIPELADEIANVKEGKGSQLLRLDGGERYRIASANRRGGRGLSGDLVIFDELREHQTWKSWSAASNTTNARARAQVWGVSNAGDLTSIVLRHLRKIALQQMAASGVILPEDLRSLVDTESIGMPDDIEGADIGLFEWSAGAERDIWDRDGWAESNPSLGVSISEAAIAGHAATDPEWEFHTEALCQFVNSAASGPFPNGSWARTMVPRVIRDSSRTAVYGVDLSHDRKMAYIAIAFWDTEGRRRVEIAARRAGTDWIIPWLESPDRKVKPEFVTFQTRGAPISSMVDDFEKTALNVVEWQGSDLAGWTGVFFDGIRKAVPDDDEPEAVLTLTHGVQPALDIAANTAHIKPLGDGWSIDRRSSPEDAAPLMAAIGAVGLLSASPTKFVSAYEDADLVIV